MSRRMRMSSGEGRTCTSACSPSTTKNLVLTGLRALEGIKDKLRLLSEHSGTGEDAEKEEDMTATCDLVDDLRDAIVDYQVSTNISNTRWTVRSCTS